MAAKIASLDSVVVPQRSRQRAAVAFICLTALACEANEHSKMGESAVAHVAALRDSAVGRAYYEYEVERTASPVLGGPKPNYPDALRRAGTGGEVVAQFIVDTTGRAEMASFKVTTTADTALNDPVRAAVAAMSFNPAYRQNHKVRQLMQQPFIFAASRGGGS